MLRGVRVKKVYEKLNNCVLNKAELILPFVCNPSYVKKFGVDLDDQKVIAENRNAFHYLSEICHEGIIEFLKSKELDINQKDSIGQSPLHYFISCRNWEPNFLKIAINAFIHANAEINMQNKEGLTPLDLYFLKVTKDGLGDSGRDEDWINSIVEASRILINAGLRFKNPLFSYSWIKHAFYDNRSTTQVEFVKVLLDGGIPIDDLDDLLLEFVNTQDLWEGASADVIHLLLKSGADPNAKTDDDQPLLSACAWDSKITKHLINFGADVNYLDYSNRSALYFCEGNPASLSLLINAGANLNNVDVKGETVLHTQGSESVVKVLIDGGIEVNCQNKMGQTALDIWASNLDIAKVLFDGGADINCLKKYETTLLHIFGNDLEIAEVLIDGGADINCQNKMGQTPIHFAINSIFNNVHATLRHQVLNPFASVFSSYSFFLLTKRIVIVIDYFKKFEANFDFVDNECQTLLHYFYIKLLNFDWVEPHIIHFLSDVEKRELNEVETALIDKGVLPLVKDNFGKTYLDYKKELLSKVENNDGYSNDISQNNFAENNLNAESNSNQNSISSDLDDEIPF